MTVRIQSAECSARCRRTNATIVAAAAACAPAAACGLPYCERGDAETGKKENTE